MTIKSKNTLHVYGVGGGGVNLALSANIPSDAAGFPETMFSFIDTSRSNLPKVVNKGEVFLIPGVNGAGKNRAFTYKVSHTQIDTILLNHPPKDFNVIIFGASGGTGSVIGPLLVEELINRGESVIAIAIISTASAKETTNAYNTIGTLQNMSTKKLDKPIVVAFYENGEETTRSDVDTQIEHDLRALAMLVSGTNLELDKKDINNWLNYDRVTAVQPQVVDLLVMVPDEEPPQLSFNAVSVANLLPNTGAVELNAGQQYSCVGYCSTAAQEATTQDIPPMYFVISNQLLNNRLVELNAKMTAYQDAEKNLLSTKLPEFNMNDSSGFIL